MSQTVTEFEVHDIRFPTSRELDGSDAMNPDPDYSAAYVVLRTDAGGRTRGPWLHLHHRPRQRRPGRRHRRAAAASPGPLGGGALRRPRLRQPRPDRGQSAALARSREGRDAHGHRRRRQRRVGPGRQACRTARCGSCSPTPTPEWLVSQIDFRYIADALTPEEALRLLREGRTGLAEREAVLLARGYPGYTTSPGWLGYSDEKLTRLAKQAVADGFTQIKLKVGADLDDDMRRMRTARAAVGDGVRIAIDANQRWNVDEAIEWTTGPGRLRPVLDRGAHQPRRHPRPRRRPPGRHAREGRHRRTRPEPHRLQAAPPGRGPRHPPDRRGPRRRSQREPRDPAARREVRGTGLPARRRRGPVRTGPAPVDVRLPGRSPAPPTTGSSSTSTTSTSTSPPPW